jgi:hypothetical protein
MTPLPAFPPPHPKQNTRYPEARTFEPFHRGFSMHDLSGKLGDARAGDTLYVRLLWAAFPSPSATKLAERAAPVLGKTERQVINHLDGTCDGKAADLAKLILLVGVEKLAGIIEGTQKR